MTTSEPLDPSLQELINRHLNEVERVLLASGVKTGERRRILDDLELQIHEMLARDAGVRPTEAEVRALLAQLDPPEAYGDSAATDDQNRRVAAPPNESKARPRLRRLRSDRILGGVCAGLARFFDVDPWNVRLLFILFSMSGSVLVYGALWLAVPIDANERNNSESRQILASKRDHSFPVAFSIAWFAVWLAILRFQIIVVPKFVDIWQQLGGELPASTRIVFHITDILLHHFFLIGIMIEGLLYAAPVALYMALPVKMRPAMVAVCALAVACFVYAIYAPLFAIPKLIK